MYVHPSLGKDVSLYLTNILLYAVILTHVRHLASNTQQKQQALLLVSPRLNQQLY